MLAEGDRLHLESKGLRYDVLPEGQMISVIIYDFPLPPGYSESRVDLLMRLPAGFPDAPPDMFWVDPVVAYATGVAPQATEQRESHHGRTWQRWSRHLAVAWRPGIDSLQTYVRLIRTDLEAGVVQAGAQAA